MNILVVEDSIADQKLIVNFLQETKRPVKVTVAPSAQAATLALDESLCGAPEKRIHLVILDLKLCETPGHEVLKKIRGHASLRPTPVVVFTSSDLREDVESSWRLRANWYVTKPFDVDAFRGRIVDIAEFWSSLYARHRGADTVYPLDEIADQEFFVQGVSFP